MRTMSLPHAPSLSPSAALSLKGAPVLTSLMIPLVSRGTRVLLYELGQVDRTPGLPSLIMTVRWCYVWGEEGRLYWGGDNIWYMTLLHVFIQCIHTHTHTHKHTHMHTHTHTHCHTHSCGSGVSAADVHCTRTKWYCHCVPWIWHWDEDRLPGYCYSFREDSCGCSR